MPKRLASVLLVVCCTISTAAAQPPGGPPDDIYQAIRTNNLARLKTLVTSRDAANTPGELGSTPLMQAAVAGSVEAMTYLLDAGADIDAQNPFGTTALMMSATDIAKVRLLLDHGASVNIASKQGRTALFIAAMADGSGDIVRLLIAKGGDTKARDAFGNTLLNAAAFGNDMATIRIMVDAGLDVNGAGVNGVTPLISAAYHGNLSAVQLLLAKGAQVNAVAKSPALFPAPQPKSGPIGLTAITPLIQAAGVGPADVVKALVDAGADVNARDGRGMTPLMLAVARTEQDAAIIRLLLDHGADTGLQSNVGETARDWARKNGAPVGLELLKVSRSTSSPMLAAPETAAPVDVKTAAERAIALIETSSQKFFESSGCVSCHHQNVADHVAAEARAKRLRFDPQAAKARLDMLQAGPPPQLLLERMDIGVPEIFASTMAALADMNVPPNPVTDTIAANIAAAQAADGSWHLLSGIGHRPPTSDGEVTRVALCIRSLKAYAPPARGAEMRARIEKARQWLLAATPGTTEERNMKLLGLFWAETDTSMLMRLAAPIRAAQLPDGGWRQHDGLATDAYATGQSLYVLAKVGALAPSDAAYQKGVKLLLATQAPNGSWRVASRAPKFQAYFNSGFPYAGDQWISAWATGWAAMALTLALPASAPRPVSDR